MKYSTSKRGKFLILLFFNLVVLKTVFSQDEKPNDEMCMSMSLEINYRDRHYKKFMQCNKRTESSEVFQKLVDTIDNSVEVTTGGTIGFEGFEIGSEHSVKTTWKKVTDREFKNSRFLDEENKIEYEYSEKSRQLFKITKVSFNIERRLNGRLSQSSIANSEETEYFSSIPNDESNPCSLKQIHILQGLASKDIEDIKREYVKDGKNVKISGPYKNTLVEKKCGKDRKYYDADFLS